MAIWPRQWSQTIETAGLEPMRREWGEGLSGLSGEQIRLGIDQVRQECDWPPSISEFRAACEGGSTAEQLAFEALARRNAEVMRQALPSKTWAERREEARAHLAECRAILAERERQDREAAENAPNPILRRLRHTL